MQPACMGGGGGGGLVDAGRIFHKCSRLEVRMLWLFWFSLDLYFSLFLPDGT